MGLLAREWAALWGGPFGAQGQNRTADTRIFSPLLYRLSYLGLIFAAVQPKGNRVTRVKGWADGAQGQNRTADTRIFSPLLYRLSYLGV